MALRDLIKANHDKAESHRFVKLLLSGNISKEIYADYLFNQMICYSVLEVWALKLGLLEGVKSICRAQAIQADLVELETAAKVYPSTQAYQAYLGTLAPADFLAHVYIRHFGDLYGGQIIKNAVPGSGTMYNFEDRLELIAKVREKLSDDLGDEANRAIEFNLQLFEEIANEHNIPAT
jgi:heme oxygenase